MLYQTNLKLRQTNNHRGNGASVHAIKNIRDILCSVLETSQVYPMGRTAEVLRGMFTHTHVLQFYVDDSFKKTKDAILGTTHAFEIRHSEERRKLVSAKLGAFSKVCVHSLAALYPRSELYCFSDFVEQIESDSCIDPLTDIKLPSFALSHAFWSNNNFFHEETTQWMDAFGEYLNSSIGQESDLPLFSEMFKYLKNPDLKKNVINLNALVARLKTHRHGQKLSQAFLETLADYYIAA